MKRLLRDRRGNALAIGAATLPFVIGGAGLAVDAVHISLSKRQLQRAADSAAIAGGRALVQSADRDSAVSYDLSINNDITLTGTPVVQMPTTGPYANNPRAVRVQLSAVRPLSFLSMFIPTAPAINVSATAAVIYDGEFCMLSLEDGNVPGVTFSGNTNVNIGCGVSSNSRAPQAITASGSSSVTATPIMAVGGVPSSGAYAAGTLLMPFAPVQEDPFRNLPQPAPTDCQPQVAVQPNATATIEPGCYNGMDIKGSLTLQPGTYFINGDSFSLGAQARIAGEGVTIVLTSTNATSDPSSIAGLSINGGAVMNMSSPTSGTYKGVLFYQDPRTPIGRVTRVNGNSASVIEGAFYFPRSYFTFNGTSGMQTRCIQLVARRLDFTGNSRVQNDCPETGGGHSFKSTYVRLVA